MQADCFHDHDSDDRAAFQAFTRTYCQHNGLFLAARLCGGATLCGALLHLAFPAIGWMPAILGANVFAILLGLGMVVAMFYHRALVRHRTLLLGGLFGTALAGTLVGAVARLLAAGKPLATLAEEAPRLIAVPLGVVVMVAAPMALVGALRARQALALAEARLRLLRAQVEPHFLFNTLGAVQQLAQHGAPRAAALTADLIAFLRASLGEMRSNQASLAEEFGLVASYLKVMQARLGERLRYDLSLPPALEGVRIPGMIVLTLAENAIKHGIEPALRGGEISVDAVVEDGVVRIRVRDTGAGMGATPGAGAGLDNVRQRLRLAYGDAAALTLSDLDPGVVAVVTLPA